MTDIHVCPHCTNGWCLDCVKELREQLTATRERLDRSRDSVGECIGRYQKAEANLAAAREELAKYQFQPIATAPKDGSRVILLLPDPNNGYWGTRKTSRPNKVIDGRWSQRFGSWVTLETSNMASLVGHDAPTHWMTLPPTNA